MAKRFLDAETELAGLHPTSAVVEIDELLKRMPAATARFRAIVGKLGDAPRDTDRACEALKSLLGPILIARRDGFLVAKMGLEIQPLSVSYRGSGGTLWFWPHPTSGAVCQTATRTIDRERL